MHSVTSATHGQGTRHLGRDLGITSGLGFAKSLFLDLVSLGLRQLSLVILRFASQEGIGSLSCDLSALSFKQVTFRLS